MGFTFYYIFASLAELLIRSDLTWINIASIKEIQLPFGYDIRYNEMAPGVLTDLHSIVGLFYFFYILMVSLKFYRSGNKEKGMPCLKDYGYKVSPFTNGAKALEEFEKDLNGFDLIITDMTMLVMTGLELSKKVLELKPLQPIILCTGHSELINKEKAIAMGISEYFEKPVIAKKIIKTIRKVIDKQK